MGKKLKKTVVVTNPLGLHARPATVIAGLLQGAKSQVFIIYNGEKANARSIMELLMLAATKDAKLVITVEGEDAEEVMARLVNAFDEGLESKRGR